MRLQPVGLRSRSFLMHFHVILAEFGKVIPWLEGMEELRFATNGEWFSEELLRRTGQHHGRITPYQFIDEDDARTFVGGILHFTVSPEQLSDRRNNAIVEKITEKGASYISCLQVREPRRTLGTGTSMMTRAIDAILRDHGSVWGVVSNHQLLPWYLSLGGKVLSPLENDDDLWVVMWD